MKNKKIIGLFVVFSILTLVLCVRSYAVTTPNLTITSNNYSDGDKITLEDEKNVEVEKTLQLYAIIEYGNDLYDPENPDSEGWYVLQANLSGVTWTSSNTSIATVDNTGKVTGVAEGKTTITANYNDESATYEVNVNPKSGSDFTGLILVDKDLTPQPALVLNQEHGFWVYLYNIPDTEKENIKVTIDNENVAKITGIDLCNWEDGSGKGLIIANAKFLSVGTFTITVSLSYNGKDYSDSYTNGVAESPYFLMLSAKGGTKLPSTLEVGDKIQLSAILGYVGSALTDDLAADKVTWTSSNEKIATVNKGLITAKKAGKVTITAKYIKGEYTNIETYNINIIDSSKSPVSPEKKSSSGNNENTNSLPTTLPKTGNSTIIAILATILVSAAFIMYKKVEEYKDIK